MTTAPEDRHDAWAFYRLAVPLITSRAGLAVMGMADALMVSRYNAHEFAWLSLAEGTLGRVLDVFVAFLIGGLSLVPRALAQGDSSLAHRLWRRTLPVSVLLGVLGLLVAMGGRQVLEVMGQPADLSVGAAGVMRVLALGYPAALLAIGAAIYLEGIGHPQVVAATVVAANVVNVGLNWVLINGHWGMPAMGATGSALSTTVVRCGLALVLGWWALRCGRGLQASEAPLDAEQWRLGLGAAGTVGALVVLTATLTAFAGWLGVLPLVIYAAAWNVAGPVALVTLGMADANGIQVAAEAGRHGDVRAARVAWTNLLRTLVPIGLLGLVLIAGADRLSSFYLTDPNSAALMASCLPFVAGILAIDAAGFVLAASLRAIREVAWPAAIDIGAMALLVPMAAALALGRGLGVQGLFVAMMAAGLLRSGVLAWRFWRRTTPANAARALDTWPVEQESTHV